MEKENKKKLGERISELRERRKIRKEMKAWDEKKRKEEDIEKAYNHPLLKRKDEFYDLYSSASPELRRDLDRQIKEIPSSARFSFELERKTILAYEQKALLNKKEKEK